VARARHAAHKTLAERPPAADEHERILDLLRRRQGAQLARLLRAHSHGKKSVIEASFGSGGA